MILLLQSKSNFGWLKTLVYDNVKSVAGIFF